MPMSPFMGFPNFDCMKLLVTSAKAKSGDVVTSKKAEKRPFLFLSGYLQAPMQYESSLSARRFLLTDSNRIEKALEFLKKVIHIEA